MTYWHKSGKVYVPDACYENVKCRVHLAFHDCTGTADELAMYSEYNNFAASNNIIIVYPESDCWAAKWW